MKRVKNKIRYTENPANQLLYTLIMITLMLFPDKAFSQYSISGKISDAITNEALAGANIIIKNTYTGIHSASDGSYQLSGLSEGEYEIIVSFLGYQNSSAKIYLKNNVILNFPLNEKALLEDEVIISATRASDKTPVTYVNLSKHEIKNINLGQDIPFLLDQTPSVVINSDAGTGIGYTGIRIRGTDLTRINVTVNGIPYNDPESHGVFFVNIPDFASSVDHIQIQRGVGTSSNGAASFGARVNFQTSSLNENPYTELSNSFGSFNTFRHTIIAGTGLLKNKFSFETRLSKISSDGYIDRAFSDLKSMYISGAYYGKKSIFKINIISGQEKTYQAWWGIPKVRLENNEEGMKRYLNDWLISEKQYNQMISSDSRTYNYYSYENETDNYQQNHYQIFYSSNLTKKLNLNTALHFTHGEGYYEQYKEDQNFSDYNIQNPIIGNDTQSITDLVRQKWLKNDFYGLSWSLNYTLGKLKIIGGGAWNKYDGDHFGKIIWAEYANNFSKDHQWYFNTGLKTDFNIYTKLTYLHKDKFNIFTDIQLRNIEYQINGFHDDLRDLTMNKTFIFINPKTGIYYQINNENSTYFSFAISNKEPSRSTFRDADNNDNPQAEKLIDYELGYNLLKKKLKINVNLYYMDYKDQLALTGEINDVGAAVLKNIPESYRIGIEISSKIKLNEKIYWGINASLSKNKIFEFSEYVDNWDVGGQIRNYLGTTDLAFSPEIISGSIIEMNLLQNFSISLFSKYVSRQFIDNTSNFENSLDPYFLNDLLINWKVKNFDFMNVEVYLKINNLFNHQYESNAWVYRYYYQGEYRNMDGYFPQAGINFLAGLTIKL